MIDTMMEKCARLLIYALCEHIPPKSLLYLIETKNLYTTHTHTHNSLSVRYKRKKKENNLYTPLLQQFEISMARYWFPLFPSFLRSYLNDKLYSILFRINRNYSFRWFVINHLKEKKKKEGNKKEKDFRATINLQKRIHGSDTFRILFVRFTTNRKIIRMETSRSSSNRKCSIDNRNIKFLLLLKRVNEYRENNFIKLKNTNPKVHYILQILHCYVSVSNFQKNFAALKNSKVDIVILVKKKINK